MGNVKRIRRNNSVLVVIDLQERLMPAVYDGEAVEDAAVKLIKGFRILGAPITVTQQYSKGLGATVAPVAEALGDGSGFNPIEKTSFSAAGTPEFIKELESLNRRNVVICGIEAHVCVMQTALDLLEAGYDVFIAADCVSSRKKSDKKIALRRMETAGVTVSTYEAILFEMLEGARESGFKQISGLVK
ncbi:MAG: hydrolase [Clostridiales Family XIII bacterium]|jgi:nicotinamidase-related amidase|nr:hydrolase [Clostridiales Family XIII bacterium]